MSKTSNYTVRIEQDMNPEDPRKYCQAGTMVCFHGKYDLGDKEHHDGVRFSDVYEAQEFHDALRGVSFPLFLYDHSGLTISTNPFSCSWDSGQIGFIYINKEQLEDEFDGDEDKAKQCLLDEVEEYDQYLTGDVWGYIIEDEDGNEIESCWGFNGYEGTEAEGKAVLEHLQEETA